MKYDFTVGQTILSIQWHYWTYIYMILFINPMRSYMWNIIRCFHSVDGQQQVDADAEHGKAIPLILGITKWHTATIV